MSLYQSMLRLHRRIYVGTDGRLGHRLLFGNPTLLLRTTGRRTGRERVVALTYAACDNAYVVTASNGGSDRAPAWLANLTAGPRCTVQIGRNRRDATAAVILPDHPEHGTYAAALNRANNNRYSSYQRRTSRVIPMVALSPN